MEKYEQLSKQDQHLVLLEIIINQPQSKSDLASLESMKKAKDETSAHITVIRENSQFLAECAEFLGIDPHNPQEYINQAARTSDMIQAILANRHEQNIR